MPFQQSSPAGTITRKKLYRHFDTGIAADPIQGRAVYSGDSSSEDEKDDPGDNVRIRSRFSSVDVPADRDPLEYLNSLDAPEDLAGKAPQKGHANLREEK